MAISRVASGNGAAGTAALSGTWVAGDLIVLVLGNSANATPPIPTGYTSDAAGLDSTNALGIRVVHKYAVGGDTMPTVSNCTSISWAIYRGVNATTPFVQAAGQSGTTATISASGIVTYQSPSDWVVIAAFAKGITGNVGSHPHTNMVLVTEYKTGSDDNVLTDSNTPLSSYAFNSKTLDAAVPWFTKTFELVAATSGGGGTPTNLFFF